MGVFGLSLRDSGGNWLASHGVDLFPYDAGTEEGTGFSLSNPATSPRGTIASMIVESARIVIEIDGERALATLLAGPDVVSIKRSRQDAQPAKHPIILDIPIALKRATRASSDFLEREGGNSLRVCASGASFSTP